MYLILIQCFFLYIYLTEIKIYRLVNAATGTGKTVAYLAPIIHHLHSYPSRIDRENGTFGMWSGFLFSYLGLKMNVGLLNWLFLLLMHLFMIEFDMVGDSVGSCTNTGALFAGLWDSAKVVTSVSLDCTGLCNGWWKPVERES
jgi:hypothetical protein